MTDAACLNSLRFDNTRYGKIINEHSGSLEWLWVHSEYRKWSTADSSRLLCIEGKPGSGKSTLMKYFKNNLLKREPNSRSAIIASFFYSYREGESQRSHYSMLRSILYDILDQKDSFFYHFQSEFRKYQALGREPGHGDLNKSHYESLQNVLLSIGKHESRERIYLLIDAIDESSDQDRRDILQLLLKLCCNNCCIFKVFVASRPVVELNHLIGKSQAVIRMQDMNKVDIQNYVQSFLHPQLESEISENDLHQAKEYILEHAQGVFLWVHLVGNELIRFVETGYSRREMFSFLQGLPRELDGLYQRMLQDIEECGDVEVTKRMFQLVLFARRPFTLFEFQHALSIADCTELIPSDECFRDSLIKGLERRIIHRGHNLLEIKGHNGIFLSNSIRRVI